MRLLNGSEANSTINAWARLWTSGRMAAICAVASGETLTLLEPNIFGIDTVSFHKLAQ